MPAPVKTVTNYIISASATSGAADSNSHVLALANGQFDVSLQRFLNAGDSDILVERYNADGSLATVSFRQYGLDDDIETDPSLTTLGGLQVLAFADIHEGTPNVSSVRLGIYNVNTFGGGSNSTAEVVVSDTVGSHYDPEVVTLANGRLFIAWVDGASDRVRGRIYDPASGTFLGASFEVGGATAQQTGPSAFDLGLTVLSNGNVAVSFLADNGFYHVRVVAPDGSPVGSNLLLGGQTDIVEFAEGGLGLIFASGGIHMRLASSDGFIGTSTNYDISTDGNDTFPAAVSLLDGRIMVVFSNSASGNVRGRIMNADGTPDGDIFDVATSGNTEQRPHLALLADGRVVVTYENVTTGNIEATIFDPRETGSRSTARPATTTTSAPDSTTSSPSGTAMIVSTAATASTSCLAAREPTRCWAAPHEIFWTAGPVPTTCAAEQVTTTTTSTTPATSSSNS